MVLYVMADMRAYKLGISLASFYIFFTLIKIGPDENFSCNV